VDSDHTKNSPETTVAKARLGMVMMLQEKCLTPELVEALLALPVLPDFCLVTDDAAADVIADAATWTTSPRLRSTPACRRSWCCAR